MKFGSIKGAGRSADYFSVFRRKEKKVSRFENQQICSTVFESP